MDMYKRDIIKQAKKFGIENRIDQTQEECAELIQSCLKYRRTTKGLTPKSEKEAMNGVVQVLLVWHLLVQEQNMKLLK